MTLTIESQFIDDKPTGNVWMRADGLPVSKATFLRLVEEYYPEKMGWGTTYKDEDVLDVPEPKPSPSTHPVKIKLGQSSVEALLKIGDLDITSLVQKVKLQAGAGKLTTVQFQLTHLGKEGEIEIESKMEVEVITRGHRFRLLEIEKLPEKHHVWANGANVCNCGEQRKPGYENVCNAPPGWPGVPSEPVCFVKEPR